jgi:hypothetical protein
MATRIVVEGLDPLIERFKEHPRKLYGEIRTTMNAALLVLWESVPGYPPPPEGSDYRRTGTLGRTLGSGEAGGNLGGTPDIYELKNSGVLFEGSFGTRLKYAPYVIGDRNDEQAGHMRHWWTIPQTVVEKAAPKIERLFVVMNEALAKWLVRKGGI